MSVENAKKHLKKYNLEERVITFSSSSATVDDAAKVAHCEPKNIAKTLSFLVNEEPIVIVCAGDAKIDNHKFKEEFNTRGSMIKYDDVEKYVGHKPGGVCPFGVNSNVKVYLDTSLKALEYVYPACGDGYTAIKLSVDELEKASEYTRWVSVCKDQND